MRYYILLPGDDGNEDYSTNVLGEASFKTFWTEDGFEIFERMVHKYPDTLEHITIKDEQSREYTPEEFLKQISKLVIKRTD